jgi:hypothetical protein
VDPAAAPAGATVTISGQGLGGGRSAWINLSHMTTTTGLNLGAKQLATVNTAPDGTPPILALNGDGTYSWGDEQGGWSFDGTTVSFDGGLGSGTVLNRRLTVESDVVMPDGATQAVRYTYIRMNY